MPGSYRRTIGAMCAVLLVACSSPAPTNGRRAPTDQQASEATVQQLEQQVRAIAKAEGCETSEQCKAVPVGAKACGGPRYYLPYCPLTTDEAALTAKLEELKRAEDAYNRQAGIVSDCAMVMKPPLELVDGACQAQTATLRTPQ